MKGKTTRKHNERNKTMNHMVQTIIGNTFALDSAMAQCKYNELRDAAGTIKMTDEEAVAYIAKKFGLDEAKIAIERDAELRVYTGVSPTAIASGVRIPREPVYNATDWRYIRFRVGDVIWEIVNDSLEMIEKIAE